MTLEAARGVGYPAARGFPLEVPLARSVLVIDDEHLLLWGLVKRFRKAGFEAAGCETAEEGLDHLEREPAGLVLLDLRLPGMDGLACLREIRERYPDTVVVMMTAHGDVESAVQAMRLGAYNYLTKPFEFDEMLAIARSALGDSTTEAGPDPAPPRVRDSSGGRAGVPAESAAASEHRFSPDSIIGSSSAMRQVRALAVKVARSATTTVLLTGESGTGKDHLAKVIHYASDRASRPFIHVNVASLPATLFESEIFGHEKGAFTGAATTKRGLLEMAHGGTVYLDEIGDLDPGVQVNLLHVLENRAYKRVGGVTNHALDVRFIAATNADLRRKVATGAFRQDLYFRLRVIPIELPPLRERGNDVLELANFFLERFTQTFGRSFSGFTDAALTKLRSHAWPGNVRELRNVIERACVLGEGDVIEADMITFEEPIEDAGGMPGGFLSETGMNLEEMERKLIQAALERASWNQVRAAQLLGLGRDALRYRMKKHHLL